jgi:hypothetical protein
MHHIRIVGESSSGAVSILWPATILAVLPAAGIIIGGWLAGKIGGAKSGIWLAVPYTIILLIVRPYVAILSTAISLPAVPVSGAEFDPGLLPRLLSPALVSTLFHGLAFGAFFGAVGGAGGFAAIRRWVAGRTSWPAWARAALMSLLISEIVFLLLLTALTAVRAGHQEKPNQVVRVWTTQALAGAKLSHYLAQGVTLRGWVEPLQIGSFKIGWFTGIAQEGKEPKRAPFWLYLLGIVPAASLVCGGVMAAKADHGLTNRFVLIASTSGAYALFQSAAVLLYTLALGTQITAGGVTTDTALTIAPSAAQAFLFGLIFALIFTTIGVSIHRPNASS